MRVPSVKREGGGRFSESIPTAKEIYGSGKLVRRMSDAPRGTRREDVRETALLNFELYLTVMAAFVLGGVMGSILAIGAGVAVAIWGTVLAAVAVAFGAMAVQLLVNAPVDRAKSWYR